VAGALGTTPPAGLKCIRGEWTIPGSVVMTSNITITTGNLTITGSFTMDSKGKLILGPGATVHVVGCADLKGDLVLSFDNVSQVPTDSVDVVFFDAACSISQFDRVTVVVANGDPCTSVTATQVTAAGKLSVVFSRVDTCFAPPKDKKSGGVPIIAFVFIGIGILAIIFVIVAICLPRVREKFHSNVFKLH